MEESGQVGGKKIVENLIPKCVASPEWLLLLP